MAIWERGSSSRPKQRTRSELLGNLAIAKRRFQNIRSKISIEMNETGNNKTYREQYDKAYRDVKNIEKKLKTRYGHINSTLNNANRHVNNTINKINRRSIYERQLNAYKRNAILKNYLESVIRGNYPTVTMNKLIKASSVFKHLTDTKQFHKLLPNFQKELRNNVKLFIKKTAVRKIRPTPRNRPMLLSRSRAAPKMKPINVKLNNVSNYTNMRRKIIKATNIPGSYELRRKLLANLNRKLDNLPRENFISLSNITPSKNTHYVLKNGNHPGTWLYLEPNSFHNLALKVGRRGTFTHPTTRRLVNIRNFKIVKR